MEHANEQHPDLLAPFMSQSSVNEWTGRMAVIVRPVTSQLMQAVQLTYATLSFAIYYPLFSFPLQATFKHPSLSFILTAAAPLHKLQNATLGSTSLLLRVCSR